MIVAFQGERGAYGDLAIAARWGDGDAVQRLGCRDFADVAAAVRDGRADAGVLPVHNTIVGAIPGVARLLEDPALQVAGEVTVPVRHCLLARAGEPLTGVRLVHSHPVALAQCGAFLARHPWMQARATHDTAGAAREVAARRAAGEGAIADAGCAARYGLVVLASDVGDRADNATRFAVVERAR